MNKIDAIKHSLRIKPQVCRKPFLSRKLLLIFIFTSNFLFSQSKSSSAVSNIACSNNGTFGDVSDDFMLFELNPETTQNYTLTATFGGNPVSVTTMDNAAATNILGGFPTYFKIANANLGAGDFTLTLTPVSGTQEIFSVTNPGTCSAECTTVSAGNVVKYTFSSPYAVTDLNTSGSLPKFDEGTNRRLRNVKIDYGITFAGSIELRVLGASGANYSFRQFSDLQFNFAGNSFTNSFEIKKNPDYPAFTFYPQGVTTIPIYDSYFNSVSYTNPSDLANFKGTGVLPNNLTTATNFSASGGANPFTRTRASYYYSVEYTYDCIDTEIDLSNISCNPNGTLENGADDFLSFSMLAPAPVLFYEAPYTYTVTATQAGNPVAVTLSDGTPATNIQYNSLYNAFRLANGSSNNGDVIITVTPNWGNYGSNTVTLTNPGSCVSAPCSGAGTQTVSYTYYSPVITGGATDMPVYIPKFDTSGGKKLTAVSISNNVKVRNFYAAESLGELESEVNPVVNFRPNFKYNGASITSPVNYVVFQTGGYVPVGTGNGIVVPAQGNWTGDTATGGNSSTLMPMLSWAIDDIFSGIDPRNDPRWVTNATGNIAHDDDMYFSPFYNNYTHNNNLNYSTAADLTNFSGNSGNIPFTYSATFPSSVATSGSVQSLILTQHYLATTVTYTYECVLPPFECSGGLGYVITNSNTSGAQANYISGLRSFNLTTATTALIDSQLIDQATNRFVNAIGYNSVDNYIYGIRQYTNEIVRVGSDGNVQILPTIGTVLNPANRYESGDVSPEGILYAYSTDASRMYSINLNPSASDYLTPVERSSAGTLYFDDFSFSPIDGMAYGVSRGVGAGAGSRLFRFNPATNTFTTIGSVSGLAGTDGVSYGTAFMDNLGNLYFANNNSGNTYKISSPHLATGGVTASLFTNLNVTPGDGARCPAPIKPITVADSGCATVGTTSSFAVSANDSAGTYAVDPLSARLIDPVTSAQSTSITIAGQGTFSINTTTGTIDFTPVAGFTGTSVDYVIADTQGNYSSSSVLLVSKCPPSSCTSESPMLNAASVAATASAGTGAQFVIDNDVAADNYWQTSGANNNITIDYGQNYVMNGFTYYPSTNGNTVLAYTVQTSSDGVNFTTAVSGSFPNYNTTTYLQSKGTPTTVRFSGPLYARYLRMIVAADGKRVAEIVPLVCGTPSTDVTCDTVPLVSTGTNTTASGKKAVRNLDNNWTVTHFAGGTGNPATSTLNYSSIASSLFYPAVVVGRAVVTSGNPSQTWATSPYGNAEWISATQNAMDINSQGLVTGADNTLPNTYFFKYRFNISDPLLVASLKLRLDYFVDNQIVRVYVNGVDQNISNTDVLSYANGHEKATLLDRDFQLGTNELVVQVFSQPGFAGLLVQGIPTCYCVQDANTIGSGTETKNGFTLLKRAGADNGNWPMIRKSAHTVLESNSKGFVPTRMTTANLSNITNPIEGMMVFDTTAKCLKIYDGTAWKCFITPTCPQ